MIAYLDNAATTKVCAPAAEAVLRAMTISYGNPSSLHAPGKEAKALLKESRETVAETLGCAAEEVYFTSGGTEGDNWALLCGAERGRRRGKHVITTAIEHPAVLSAAAELKRRGFEVTYIRPDKQGNISAGDVEAELRPDTVLVSAMLVNNEIGTVLPIREIADAIARTETPALLHVDAVQGFLKLPFTPKELGADLLTISGHKIRGPKGIGALYIQKGVRLAPLLFGGGQEEGLRPGTEPLPAIAGFAAACAYGRAQMEQDVSRMADLRAKTLDLLRERGSAVRQVGAGTAPHILSLTLPAYLSQPLVRKLSDCGVYISAGSACHKGKPSETLAAMNLSKPERDGAFRVSFSPDSTQEEVELLVDALIQAEEELFPAM